MPKAERFYREMLNETGESALNETLVGVGAGISLKVLSEQDVAMDKLQKSIVGLNDAFARRNENSELTAKAGALGATGVAIGLETVEVPVAVATAAVPAIALTAMDLPAAEVSDVANIGSLKSSATNGDSDEADNKPGEKSASGSKLATRA